MKRTVIVMTTPSAPARTMPKPNEPHGDLDRRALSKTPVTMEPPATPTKA